MKYSFILDENIIRASLKCSAQANALIMHIARNGHKIVVGAALHESYWASLRRERTSLHYPFVQPILGALVRDASRCEFLVDLPDPSTLPVHHRKDVFLAQLARAAASRPLIVSRDKATREDLNKMGVEALTLDQAIERARET